VKSADRVHGWKKHMAGLLLFDPWITHLCYLGQGEMAAD